MSSSTLSNVLDVSRLPRTQALRVNAATVEDYTDSTGEPALRVTAILDEDVDGAEVPGDEVGNLKWAIRRQLQDRGITLFPYISFTKKSELDDTGEE